MAENQNIAEEFAVGVADDQTLLLTIYKPAPWLWKSKENILAPQLGNQKNLIVDLKSLKPNDVSAFTLGDYLKNTLTDEIETIALVGDLNLMADLPYFVHNISKRRAQAFDSVAKAMSWLRGELPASSRSR